jgi:drug/metabolite transporter (DMT)-like permease
VPAARPDDLRRGALFMVTSAFLFAAMGVAVKTASRTLPNAMVVFMRSGIGLLFLTPWAVRAGPRGLRTAAFPEHVVRGVAGLAAMYCFFYAIGHLRLADAVLLNYSLPLFMPFVAWLWLREPVPARLFAPLLVGFLGLVLILKPGLALFNPVGAVGLLAALFGALAQTGIRRLSLTEPITLIVFYFALISTVLSALPLAVAWTAPDRALWGVLVAMGLLATAGQLFLTRAYAQAPAAQVGPFIYSSVVFAAAFDWLVWGKLPDALSAAGSLLVVTAGVLTLRAVPAAAARVVPAD